MEFFKVNVKIDGGHGQTGKSISVRKGENLLTALQREFSDMKLCMDRKYGLEVAQIAGIKKSKTAGVHFKIDGKVPTFLENGSKLYLSLYHIDVSRNMDLHLELVSIGCDFSNSVVDPRLSFRTPNFDLEELPGIPQNISLKFRKSSVLDYPHRLWMLPLRWQAFQFDSLPKAKSKVEFEFLFGSKKPEQFQDEILPLHQHGTPSFAEIAQLAEVPLAPVSSPQPTQPSPRKKPQRLIQGAPSLAIEAAPTQNIVQANAASHIPRGLQNRNAPKSIFKSAKFTAQLHAKAEHVPVSSLKGIKAIIFDLDGVVVDSEHAHLATFNQALEELGIKIEEKTWKHNYTGVGSYRILEDLFRKNHLPYNVKEWVGKRAEIYQKYIEKNGLPEIPGFVAFHSFIKKHGIKTIVASGGHRPHIAASLRSIGLPKMKYVGLEDVKNPKPHPEMFLLAAKKIGVKPSECIVFEDSLAGVTAARSAGMACIALSTTLPAKMLQGRAIAVIPNYNAKRLRKLVVQLVAKNRATPVSNMGRAKAKPRRTPKRSSRSNK
ncbi:MAG: HAD family phosphatase [Candidatus Micrarchaeota archaeon]|nr:HAD family phosphatase [Candidatus Micrarchaeota archaeon]